MQLNYIITHTQGHSAGSCSIKGWLVIQFTTTACWHAMAHSQSLVNTALLCQKSRGHQANKWRGHNANTMHAYLSIWSEMGSGQQLHPVLDDNKDLGRPEWTRETKAPHQQLRPGEGIRQEARNAKQTAKTELKIWKDKGQRTRPRLKRAENEKDAQAKPIAKW